MRRRLLRIGLGIAVAAVLLVVLLVAVVHVPAVQRRAFELAAARLEAATGWSMAADGVRLNLLTGTLRMHGIEVSAGHGTVASVARLEAQWTWRGLLGSPPRLESLEIARPVVDLTALPPSSAAPQAEGAPFDAEQIFTAFELGRLRVEDGTARAAAAGVDLEGRDVRVTAGLVAARLTLEAGADGVSATRDGRTLAAGPVELGLAGGADGLRLEKLRVAGEDVALRLDGRGTLPPSPGVDLDVDLEADVARVLQWWDPSLLPAGTVGGVLHLAGRVTYGADGLTADLEHQGAPLRVAGYSVATLSASFNDGVVHASAAGPEWGSVDGVLDADRGLHATAHLQDLDLRRLARSVPVELPVQLPPAARASGDVEVATALPPTLESVSGRAQLQLAWQGGRATVDASAADGAIRVSRLDAAVGGAELQASGRLTGDRQISGQGTLDVPDPAHTEAAIAALLGMAPFGLGGGPLHADVEVAGSLTAPRLQLGASWERPAYGELCAARLDVTASAAPDEPARWEVFLVPLGSGTVHASGTTGLPGLATSGEWQLALPDLAAAVAGLEPLLGTVDLHGGLTGAGTASWDGSSWQATARLDGDGIGTGPWQVGSAHLELAADPAEVVVSRLHAELAGGTVDGRGRAGLDGFDAPVAARLEVAGLELSQLPLPLPEGLAGVAELTADVSGTLGRPELDLTTSWAGHDAAGPARALQLQAAVADGVASFSLPRLDTAAGNLNGRGTAPLGDVPRPAWLWPDAPGGPLRLTLVGSGLESAPLMAALGQPELPAQLSTDLSVDVSWDLSKPAERFAEVRLDGLEVENAVETLHADGPVVLHVDGQHAVLEQATLAGARSNITAGGSYALATGELDAHAAATLAPEMAQLVPLALQVRKPLQLTAEVEGTLDDLTGRIEVQHPDGRIVMRDPALSVEDLDLVLVLEDGALWIDDGSATVNRGTVQLGGGWDPASGQGIVIEMNDVVALLPYDILTRWSGDLAIEPDPERLFNVTGDLVLEGGVWDRPVDLTGLVFGPTTLAPAADDPLWEIGLDLEVRGRGGLAVNNNLGDFQVTWNELQVSGVAAQPVIIGDITIAPGGSLNLAGRHIEVQRGTVGFTGDPVSDPVVEIVPMQDVAVFSSGAGGEGGGIDTTMIARRGVAQGLGSVLGLENETLRPAEIAIESDTTTTTNFTAGQRLSRYVALFLTTDLSNVQDRTTTLQLWNFDPLPGLALQLWERTGDENQGVNLVERFSWGGTGSTDDRPTVHSVTLKGDWPGWKWSLKRKLGLAKGQPYEPFLGFAASLRLERELAARGWQQAQVDLQVEGPERLPALEFTVDPGPRHRVEFVGDTPPSHLRREVTALYQPPPLEQSAFDGMVDLLDRHFRSEGYPNADVTVARREDGTIVVTVDRGAKLTYEGPVVEGAPPPQAEAIRRVLGTPAELVALLEDPDRGARIVQRILQAQGYRQATLKRVWAERVEGDVSRVHLEVDPGPRATIRNLEIKGSDPLGLVAEERALAAGQPLDRQEIELAADRVRRGYRNHGYLDAAVTVRYQGDDPGPWDLLVELSPGTERTVGEIRFVGRKSIGRRTLMRGVDLEPGEPLRRDQLDQSVIDLASFAPVERVNAKVVPAGAGASDVEFDIVERDRWTVEAGAGWSSDRGAEGRFGVRDGGLFGRGGSVYLRGRWQTDDQLVLLNAELPPLPGRKLSYGTSLSFHRQPAPDNPDRLVQDVLTSSLELTREFGSGVSVHPYYQFSRTISSARDPYDTIASLFAGTLDVATLGAQLRSDRLDNPFDPRRGTYLGLDLGWSSSLIGSELETLRSLFTGTAALTPREGWTWAQTLRVGQAKALKNTDLTSDVKFFAGGQASIRGFDRNLVGPVTVDYEGNISPDGGGALLVLNEELRIPVWNGLRVAVFTDVGQVWETWSDADLSLAVGAGLGLRYTTPIGPLWADVAWPVANQGYSSDGPKFYVGIGRPF